MLLLCTILNIVHFKSNIMNRVPYALCGDRLLIGLVILSGFFVGCDLTTSEDRSVSSFDLTIESPDDSFTVDGSAVLLRQRTSDEAEEISDDFVDLFDGQALAEIRASAIQEGLSHTLDIGYVSNVDLAPDETYSIAAQTVEQPMARPDSSTGISVLYTRSTRQGVDLYLVDAGELFTEYVDKSEVRGRIALEARYVVHLDGLPFVFSPLIPLPAWRFPTAASVDTLETPLTLEGTFTALPPSR